MSKMENEKKVSFQLLVLIATPKLADRAAAVRHGARDDRGPGGADRRRAAAHAALFLRR